MFHCNGWCFPWTVAMLGGTHVCLRKVEAAAILDAMREHARRPLLRRADRAQPADRRAGRDARRHRAQGARHGRRRGAAGGDDRGHGADRLRHHARLRPDRGLRAGGGGGQARRRGRGERSSEQTRLQRPPGRALRAAGRHDGARTRRRWPRCRPTAQTMGEIMFRGNIVMKGYLKNPAATDEAFAGGWFHTGDLAVLEPDRYVKIKDRSKDIIISGGENISSHRGRGCALPPPGGAWPARWSRGPIRSGARRRSPSSSCKPGAGGRRRRADRALQARCSPATRCRARSASRRSRRPRPARSRSSSCASARSSAAAIE